MIGDPKQVADYMEDWYTNKACDGFIIGGAVMPRGFNDFVDLVVPELQRRGLFRKDYEAATLRENLGLAIPKKSLFCRQRNSRGIVAFGRRRSGRQARTSSIQTKL